MAEYDDTEQEKLENIAMLVYILMLVAPIMVYTTALIGVIIAYVYRDDTPEWLSSHFQLQIRTFWIGFLFLVISLVLMVILIGKLVLLLAFIWYLVRLIKGIRYLHNKKAYPNPTTWGL